MSRREKQFHPSLIEFLVRAYWSLHICNKRMCALIEELLLIQFQCIRNEM